MDPFVKLSADIFSETLIPSPSVPGPQFQTEKPPVAAAAPVFTMADSDDDDSDEEEDLDDDDNFPTRGPIAQRDPTLASTFEPAPPMLSSFPLRAPADSARLFTREEIAVLPAGVLDKHKLKQQAKKAKKRKAAAERTEGELMYGLMGMGVEEQAPIAELDDEAIRRISGKKARKERKKAKSAAASQAARGAAKGKGKGVVASGDMDVEDDDDALLGDARKEADFANFLANVGGE
jgi:nuclear GTP-binding protein